MITQISLYMNINGGYQFVSKEPSSSLANKILKNENIANAERKFVVSSFEVSNLREIVVSVFDPADEDDYGRFGLSYSIGISIDDMAHGSTLGLLPRDMDLYLVRMAARCIQYIAKERRDKRVSLSRLEQIIRDTTASINEFIELSIDDSPSRGTHTIRNIPGYIMFRHETMRTFVAIIIIIFLILQWDLVTQLFVPGNQH